MPERNDYEVVLRQMPEMGKACGIADIPSRSYLYPALVLELRFPSQKSPTRSFKTNREFLEQQEFVCHVTLLTDEETDANIIPGNDKPPRRGKDGSLPVYAKHLNTMAGQRSVPGTILTDPTDGLSKIFFVYTDLSLRITGRYRFSCHVIEMKEKTVYTRKVISDPVQIYSLVDFPGGPELTILSQAFVLQGMNPPSRGYNVKKQVPKKEKSNSDD